MAGAKRYVPRTWPAAVHRSTSSAVEGRHERARVRLTECDTLPLSLLSVGFASGIMYAGQPLTRLPTSRRVTKSPEKTEALTSVLPWSLALGTGAGGTVFRTSPARVLFRLAISPSEGCGPDTSDPLSLPACLPVLSTAFIMKALLERFSYKASMCALVSPLSLIVPSHPTLSPLLSFFLPSSSNLSSHCPSYSLRDYVPSLPACLPWPLCPPTSPVNRYPFHPPGRRLCPLRPRRPPRH